MSELVEPDDAQAGGPRRSLTIAQRLVAVGAAGFVGRQAELDRVAPLLAGQSERNVVFIHGPGGIGKSTLLREVVRRARLAGWTAVEASVADLLVDDKAWAELLDAVRQAPKPLVAIDEWDQAGASSGAVRDDVLGELPANAVVVLAGRLAPDNGWWGGGWERLLVEIALAPLGRDESMQLLEANGVEEFGRQSVLAGWAGGSPLGLVLAAGASPDWEPDQETAPPALVSRLSQRLLDGGIEARRVGVLAVAAVARVTTPAVLAAALPAEDADESYDWLCRQSFVEPRGDGVALHALVAQVVLAEATSRHPEGVRDIRRRLADHLWAQALRSGSPFSPDLVHLIQDPAIKWGIGWDDSGNYRVDRVRSGDIEVIKVQLVTRSSSSHWPWLQRYIDEAPSHVGVVRSRSGAIEGVMVTAAPGTAAPLCADDPILGPWLEHARSIDDGSRAVLWRHAIDFNDSGDGAVQRLMGTAGLNRSGLPNPRYVYLPIDPTNSAALAFSAALNATHLSHLDVDDGVKVTECHIGDLGVGGILGAHRAAVYLDLGLPLPPEPTTSATLDSVREALRVWDDPNRLSQTPLAQGSTVEERSEFVRRLVREGVDRAFGDNAADRPLREVLEAGYLHRNAGHDATARAIHLSRAAYFRRLKEATERLAVSMRTG